METITKIDDKTIEVTKTFTKTRDIKYFSDKKEMLLMEKARIEEQIAEMDSYISEFDKEIVK